MPMFWVFTNPIISVRYNLEPLNKSVTEARLEEIPTSF
jgi:hypothetical protein